MTISRGQMKRQLYEGGGIMTLSKEGIGGGDYKGIDMGSRTGFGLIKKIASSDVGKAALLYGATAGLGALGAGAARSGTGFGFLSPSNVMSNLSSSFINFKSTPNVSVKNLDTNPNVASLPRPPIPLPSPLPVIVFAIVPKGLSNNLARGPDLCATFP